MSTKKLQIITPIVTSVNGQTGDVTLDVSGSGDSMKKLTFTGGATGEYDGSNDVSVTIPEDRFYVLNLGEDADKDVIITNDYDEVIEAINTCKLIALMVDVGDISLVTTQINTDSSGVVISITIVFTTPGQIVAYDWIKETKKLELLDVYEVPCVDGLASSSGVIYRDASKWTVKDLAEFSLPYCILRYSQGQFNKSEAEIKQAFQKGAIFLLDTASGESSSSGTVPQVLQPLYPCVTRTIDHIPDSINFIYIFWLSSGNPKIVTLRWNYNRDGMVTETTRELLSYKAGNGISISYDGTISVTAAKMYSGTSTPADSLGENGDIYLQTEG